MQKWYFNGVDLCTKAWYVESVLDGLGPPGFRGEDLAIPLRNGTKNIKKRYNRKNITLAMWVTGLDKDTGLVPDGKTIQEALIDNIDYLGQVFGIRGVRTLTRLMPDYTIREAQAEVYTKVNFVTKAEGYSKFTVEFELANPFFYSSDLIAVENIITGSPYTWTQEILGQVEVSDAKITLIGPLTKPKLENLSSGVWVQYNGTIGSNEIVTIDPVRYTCDKDGINMISLIKHAGDPTWMIFLPGDNSMYLSAEAYGGTCRLEYYPLYF